MREHPILFTGPMVCGLLDDTKTQTRRIVQGRLHFNPELGWDWCRYPNRAKGGWATSMHYPPILNGVDSITADCPYGQPGDRLWVRERMRRVGAIVRNGTDRPLLIDVRYEADGAIRFNMPFPDRLKGVPKHGQCLSYGGYREASRITLEITEVRVERLQDISEEDAYAEGITAECTQLTPYLEYMALWESINGPGSWDLNPWVWCVSFKRITP